MMLNQPINQHQAANTLDPIQAQPQIQDQGSWVCGSEWIVVRGPNGELIVSEIPLKCDPFADTYTGDPSPIDEEK